MITSQSSPEKRLFNWQEQQQQQSNTKNDIDTTLFWTRNFIVLSIGSIMLTFIVTFVAVIYWCSKQQKLSKTKSHPSELSSFTTHSINVKASRPKEIKLFPIVPKLIQPNSSSFILPTIEDNNYNNLNHDRFTTDTCSTADSSSSSTAIATKKFRKKNLLERRGSNNSLTISIAPKHRLLNSPPVDCPSDEYLLTATRKLTIDELHQHAQDARLLYHEFWTIPTNHLEKLRICGAGTKNRYGTIIANDHSRVKLSELPGDPLSSYINANYVTGYPNEYHAFIATQGPLANTIIDFYRMIWQEHVPVIIMITRLFEKNKAKCERYIPDSQPTQYGPFHVQIKSISYQTDYEIRRLIIEFENEQREIEHYWYTAWPDQSCPDNAQPLIELVKNVEKSRLELSNLNKHFGPIVVHCSAGIGRTGCFIALSNGVKQLDNEHIIDIVRILCDLRRDRGGMIQTNDQYQFVYQALSEYARTLQFSS
ncbi:unnamed protein product [Rotaria sordida]|uniref:protein-tyrosine-phosphatase n=1 Tax=Rotaria sordida TaxID=392033 RepID=A0A818W1T8_9BILA|nr:unnamed protein product [Rotaria sordida]CAF0913974.1 unnamed protein product [Rotaria sordida]CAF3503635.1 unnamed protein product [Rotaria sordida]CAF3610379.1 unnamed protein product [Rotaria sordida]CAF3719279.1 unnamed protein product [Rotaria sordida]